MYPRHSSNYFAPYLHLLWVSSLEVLPLNLHPVVAFDQPPVDCKIVPKHSILPFDPVQAQVHFLCLYQVRRRLELDTFGYHHVLCQLARHAWLGYQNLLVHYSLSEGPLDG